MSRIFRMAACIGVLIFATVADSADKSEYRIGDRLPHVPGKAVASAYEETGWHALAPADWDPAKDFSAMDFGALSDSDPKAIAALEKLRAAWDNAPIVPALDGRRIRIAGFMVPLDAQKGMVREFLLVPYFGACIHTPPPPANQIIHVVAVKPYKSEQSIDAVWVSGTLAATRAVTAMGSAGYRLRADTVTPFAR